MNAPISSLKTIQHQGLALTEVEVTTQANAKAAMVTLQTALTSISDELSRAGAYENRFGHTISVLELTAKATKISRGRIMDADMAEESTKLSKVTGVGSSKHRHAGSGQSVNGSIIIAV